MILSPLSFPSYRISRLARVPRLPPWPPAAAEGHISLSHIVSFSTRRNCRAWTQREILHAQPSWALALPNASLLAARGQVVGARDVHGGWLDQGTCVGQQARKFIRGGEGVRRPAVGDGDGSKPANSYEEAKELGAMIDHKLSVLLACSSRFVCIDLSAHKQVCWYSQVSFEECAIEDIGDIMGKLIRESSAASHINHDRGSMFADDNIPESSSTDGLGLLEL